MNRFLLLLILSFSLFTIKANAQCNASFTYTQNSQNLGYINFTNTSTIIPSGGFYSNWTFGDGTGLSGVSPIHQYTSPGVYTVILSMMAHDSSCWDTTSTIITVTSVPNYVTCGASFSGVINQNNMSISFVNQSFTTTAGNLTYLWDFGDGSTSTLQNPGVHYYQHQGIYSVNLTVSNAICASNYVSNFQIGNPNVCTASFTPDFVVSPGNVLFQNHSYGNNYLDFSWSFGDGTTSTDPSPIHHYATQGVYTVTLWLTSTIDTSCHDQYTSMVTVGPNSGCLATFDIVQDSLNQYHYYLYDMTIGNNLIYDWNFGDGNSSTAMNPSHTYQDTSTYYICLTVHNSTCQSTFCDSIFSGRSSGQFSITVIPGLVGINEVTTNDLTVYPNPASETINILSEDGMNGQLVITDITGRIVVNEAVSATRNNSIKKDISAFAPGIYTITLVSNSGKSAHRTFVK